MGKAGRQRGSGFLNKKTMETLLSYLSIGAHVETAAAAAGIHRKTFYEWLKRGAEAVRLLEKGEAIDSVDQIYLDLHQRMSVTIAEAEINDLNRIDTAAEQVWQAAAWKLERRFPNRYALHPRISQEQITVDLSTLTNAQLKRIAAGEPIAAVLSGSDGDSEPGE